MKLKTNTSKITCVNHINLSVHMYIHLYNNYVHLLIHEAMSSLQTITILSVSTGSQQNLLFVTIVVRFLK